VVFTVAIAVAAQAREPKNPIPPHTGSRDSATIMPRLIQVEGQLGYDDGIGPQIPEFGVWVGPFVRAGDHWYGLDFGKNKELQEAAKVLYGSTVIVDGIPEVRTLPGLITRKIDVIVVTNLKVSAIRKTVTVEGRLTKKVLFIPFRPDPCVGIQWELAANGTTYVLDLPHNERLWSRAENLAGERVAITGYFGKDGQFVVLSLTDHIVFQPIPLQLELA
jgi:hypothetical protein